MTRATTLARLAPVAERLRASRAAWTGVLVVLATALAWAFGGTATYQLAADKSYDLISMIAPARPSSPGALVVAIDEPSFAEIGQRWPWPRSLHARLVRALRKAGAHVVALDIVFAEATTPEEDADLAAALGPDVVLGADEETIALDQGTQTSRIDPLPSFMASGASAGLTSVALDGDGALRRLPPAADGFAARTLAAGGSPVPPPADARIQFFGEPRTYPTISYYQALDPGKYLPPDRLKGQTVLVGLSLKTPPRVEAGGADAFVTPWTLTSRHLTAGVEAQATILDNLRHGLWVRPLGRPGLAVLVVLAALAAAAAAGSTVTWRTALVAAVSVMAIVAGSWVLLRFGRVFVSPVLPAFAASCVFGMRFGLDFAVERRLRRAVSEAFSRYVSPDLVRELARDPGSLQLGGKLRDLTILFCDVRGFTSLSERLKDDPQMLTSIVNRLLDALSAEVLAKNGTIDKYMGDCVMAFWNAPLDCAEHERAAVRAALAMGGAVERVNAEIAAGWDGTPPKLAVGVGINTGRCVVGNMGSRWRYDYSVLGDPVNLASRLESLTKELGVALVLGPATAAAVAEDYVLLELDRIAVRGRSEKTPVFTVLAPAAERCNPRILELIATHRRLMEALSSGNERAAQARELAKDCRALAPEVAGYYDTVLDRLDGLS